MLTIRREQIAALDALALRLSLQRLVREFEVLRPQHFQAMGARESEEFLRRTVNQGLVWGIRIEKDVWALIDLMLAYGDFHLAPDRPWALPILNHPTLSGTAKIKVVTANLRERLD